MKSNTTHHPVIFHNSNDILNRCHTASTSEGLVNILTQSMTQLFTWTDMIYVLTGLLAFLPPIIASLSYTKQSSNTDTQYAPLHTDRNSTLSNEEGSKFSTTENKYKEKGRKNTHHIRVTTSANHAERKSYSPHLPSNSNPLPGRNTSVDSYASYNKQPRRLPSSV